MRLEVVDLRCSHCYTNGCQELLYLGERVRGSRCLNCGFVSLYTDHPYLGWALEVTERSRRLPAELAQEAWEAPIRVWSWPARTVRKPKQLIDELRNLRTFEKAAHRAKS